MDYLAIISLFNYNINLIKFSLTSKPKFTFIQKFRQPNKVLICNLQGRVQRWMYPQNTPAAVLSKLTGNEVKCAGFDKSERGCKGFKK